ncbi:MAG: FAD-binding oxidoreductase [Calditrichales bacterium]|nr:MAG: FAD-binding oxidoreductase [Calditrichales bacterium]
MNHTLENNLNLCRSTLRDSLGEKVRWDDVTMQLYSTAACIYEITPLAIVIPENDADICTAVTICSRHAVPILPRGAGSSLAGNSVGEAVILDLTHHFKSIKGIAGSEVSVQVGVVLNDLQALLKTHGRIFGPDPSSGNVCVIGGMLGNNAGGPHSIRHGNMYRHVNEISVILANGKRFSARNIPLTAINDLDDFHKPYYEKIRSLLTTYKNEINSEKPAVTKNASGYQVWDILTEEMLNMASLFVGSEGTLGVFTDAILKTELIKPERGVISFYFQDLARMGKAVQILRELGASAIEFVDHSFIRLALKNQPELKSFLPENVKYLLYVEFEGTTTEGVTGFFQSAIVQIEKVRDLGQSGSFSTDQTEIDKIFTVRKSATSILNKIEGKNKPIPFVEDASIHPDRFPEFLTDAAKLLEKYNLEYVAFGHAGDGNLHIRPLIDLKNAPTLEQAKLFMNDFVDLVLRYKGSLSAEHGDGRLRTPFLPKAYPGLISLFRQIKHLFDPNNLMNPGIIVSEKTLAWDETHFRYSPAYTYQLTDSLLDTEQWRDEIEKCHGCGTCRDYCPVFIATGEEEATARAKANILRSIISGKLSNENIDSDHFYRIMDYCLNCGQCLTDCPTAVDIPGMAVAAKEKLHRKKLFKINEYILQNGRLISRLTSMAAPLANPILKTGWIRVLMDYITGIDQRRQFPEFKARKIHTLPIIRDYTKHVVLWSGCAAVYNDAAGEYQQSVRILEKLGYTVEIPPWKCCNIAKISYGNLSATEKDIDFNTRILLPYAAQDIPIIFSSASCGFAFIKEYGTHFPHREDLKKIAAVSCDIHDFLVRAYKAGAFKDPFRPVNRRLVYHEPCHLKAQQQKFGPKDLLQLIPGIELLTIEDSCCGIAGTFGMKKENYDLSMKIGNPLFEQIEKVKPQQLVSGCGTCQTQLNQGTGIKTVHPISILAESYLVLQ